MRSLSEGGCSIRAATAKKRDFAPATARFGGSGQGVDNMSRALITGHRQWHDRPMSYLGPPNRGREPLHIWLIALALVAAAALGAAIGFVIDFGGGAVEAVSTPVEKD
jgi:hypothetical protein